MSMDYNPMKSLNESIMRTTSPGLYVAEKGENDGAEYKKFFKAACKKFGCTKPSDLDDDKKKEFYAYIDKNWKSDDEEDGKSEGMDKGKGKGKDSVDDEDDPDKKKAKVGKSGKQMRVEVDPKLEEWAEDFISDIGESVDLDEASLTQSAKNDAVDVIGDISQAGEDIRDATAQLKKAINAYHEAEGKMSKILPVLRANPSNIWSQSDTTHLVKRWTILKKEVTDEIRMIKRIAK